VDEAIYLSDRIVIMTPRPGKIESILDVNFSRPRERNNEEFMHMRARILEILHFAKKPDELSYYL
jgi:ABC-type nitrate/sulfonate/bicarbonate transport system ATPase subunit